MPDAHEPTPGAQTVSTPRSADPKNPEDSAEKRLIADFLALPEDRQQALLALLPRPAAATGCDVIDDLAEMDFDDPAYLILDPLGGCDED